MQHTLKAPFTLEGKGLHTGLHLSISFLPAPADYGYKIQRMDLEGQPFILPLARKCDLTLRVAP